MVLLLLVGGGALLQIVHTPSSANPVSEESATGAYPVVDTAQTTCYDSSGAIACPAAGQPFYGQDAQITGNAPGYTANGDPSTGSGQGGTVTDNVTGLTWTQSPDLEGDGDIDAADKLPYPDALAYCQALSFAGHDDWRLPSIKELYSLMDFSGTDPSGPGSPQSVPFIDTDYFAFAYGDESAGERIIDAQFASSTLYAGTVMNNRQAMFGLNLADGRIKGYPTTKDFYVLCTRGNPDYGTNTFVAHGNGTITDQATGLMWAQDDSGQGLNWEDALAYVAQMNAENYLGYSDWRLPNAKELQSLVDYSRSPDTTGSAALDPLFNATALTNEAGQTDYPFYWSSTTHVRADGSGTTAVYLAFGRGLGSMNGTTVIDVHGAGCQRSDPKDGDPADYPTWGFGPQGDVQRVFNYVRLVRGGTTGAVVTGGEVDSTTGGEQPPQDADRRAGGEGELPPPPPDGRQPPDGPPAP
jgi:hypothetical protein